MFEIRVIIEKILPYILGSIMLIEYFDGSALNLIFPELATTFVVEATFMKIALTSYLISQAIFIPICGHLSHKINLKHLLQIGITLMLIGSVGCALSTTITSLIFFRSIQGISAAFITPTCRLYVLKKFDKNMRLIIINKVMGTALIGLVAGPLISGFLIKTYNWQLVFYIFTALSIIILLLITPYLPNYKDETNEAFDIPGYLILASAIATFFLFFSLTIKNGERHYTHVFLLMLSILLL